MKFDRKDLAKALRKSAPVLLLCFLLNLVIIGGMWFHYSGKLSPFISEVIVTLENNLLDRRLLLRGPLKPSQKIGVLGLDEKSIQKFGRWPFSRGIYEQAFKNLKSIGVEWIGFDVVWDQPERPLLADAWKSIERIKTLGSKGTKADWENLQSLQIASAADKSVARAIANHEKIVLGYLYYTKADEAAVKAIGDEKFAALPAMESSYIAATILPEGKELKDYPVLNVDAVVGNTPFIAKASEHFGYFNNDMDADSVARWVSLVRAAEGNLLPSISLKMAANILSREIVVVFDRYGVEEIMLVNLDDDKDVLKIPMDPLGEGRMMINHLGKGETIPTFSLADAYDNTFTPAQRRKLKGMSLLMGPTAMAINDMRASPFDPNFNGVEHHAAAVDNIVSKRFFHRPPNIYKTEMYTALAIGVLFSLILAYTSALTSALGAVLFCIAYFYVDRYFWFSNGIWAYMGMPYIQISSLFVGVTLFKYFTEEREKKKVKGAFQHYLSPDVMNQVLDDPTKLKLGGERRLCTVFFSDVRGFTTISESLSPEKLTELMNDYLSPMTDIILKSSGVLDKYIGDAIMAFWGAPLDRPDQADVAARCVLQMMERLEIIRTEFPKKGFPVIDIGCGLNTGLMSVGNMGSHDRFAYTVMGDNVNLGARLESITKEYGVRAIVGESTVAKMADPKAYFLRDMDYIVVKGKKEPVKIYELIHPMILPNEQLLRELLGNFSRFREAYVLQDWEASRRHLAECLKIRPSDGPSLAFLERVQELEKSPKIENWDGVHVFKHK
jgi:adenylate cyclase